MVSSFRSESLLVIRQKKNIIIYPLSPENPRFRIFPVPSRFLSSSTISIKPVRATSAGNTGLNFKLVDPATIPSLSTPICVYNVHRMFQGNPAPDFNPQLIHGLLRGRAFPNILPFMFYQMC